MPSYVVPVLLGLLASPALADDKLENPNAPAQAPADAPVAAPTAPDGTAPNANPATPAPNAPAASPTATTATPAPNTPATPAPIAKVEAAPDPLANLPKKCEPFAKRMAVRNAAQAMSARISLANCLADVRLAPLALLDTQESMLEVEAAIAPSFQLLDDVIARGDQQNQLLAHHAKMIVVQQAATRMLASVPAPAQPTVEAAQLRDSRRALVEQMIQPWRLQIADEARAANAIAKANPKLEKVASVQIALRDTKKAAPEAIATAGEARPAQAPEARPAKPAGTAEGTLR